MIATSLLSDKSHYFLFLYRYSLFQRRQQTYDLIRTKQYQMVEIEIKKEISSPETPVNAGIEMMVQEVDVLRGREMIRRHSGSVGSICYVVRRPGACVCWMAARAIVCIFLIVVNTNPLVSAIPGCCLCREQAWTLTMLAAHPDSPLKGFRMFGVVKETGVDQQGLAEFGTKFFPFPLYCDKSYSFYHALGDRRLVSSNITSLLNPISVFSFLNEAYRRIAAKEIGGNLKGEGVVQGGIVIFDKNGTPKYAYQEETGSDIPIADLLLAIEALKRDMLEEVEVQH